MGLPGQEVQSFGCTGSLYQHGRSLDDIEVGHCLPCPLVSQVGPWLRGACRLLACLLGLCVWLRHLRMKVSGWVGESLDLPPSAQQSPPRSLRNMGRSGKVCSTTQTANQLEALRPPSTLTSNSKLCLWRKSFAISGLPLRELS